MSIDWIFSPSNAMHIVKECKEELFSSLLLVKKVSNVLKLNYESGHENCFWRCSTLLIAYLKKPITNILQTCGWYLGSTKARIF